MATINDTNRKDTAPKKRGRPPKNQSRVEGSTRPRERVPVSGQRDILSVLGKDPDFHYHFVADKSENGARIMKFLRAGYTFVEYEDDLGIGADNVYLAENVGSIVRLPDGGGKYLYLMKQKMEWYEEDQAAKQREISKTEGAIKRKRDAEEGDGMYGEGKFSTKSYY